MFTQCCLSTHRWLQSLDNPEYERKLLLLCSDDYKLLLKLQKRGLKWAACDWSVHCHVPKVVIQNILLRSESSSLCLGERKNNCLILTNKRCRSTSLQYTYRVSIKSLPDYKQMFTGYARTLHCTSVRRVSVMYNNPTRWYNSTLVFT